MQCPRCQSSNAPEARFCEDCGVALSRACSACGRETRPQARFCSACGASLVAGARDVNPAALASKSPGPAVNGLDSGERRQLTVVFSDIVGSTEMSTRLDPEEWREVVAAYHRGVAATVQRFDGHVAQYLGDGVLVFFGWPRAREDDAERAVRAGLAMVEEVRALNAAVEARHGLLLRVRVGIHTGLVVAGRGADDAPEVFGETPNIAARVQTAAAPDTVLITEATQRLVAGLFIVDAPRSEHLKGVGEPFALYRVQAASGIRGRLRATARHGLTPFVGREHERQVLFDRWERARAGDGQVVLITGEAGIGKSRLVQQFKEDLGAVPHTWLESAGSPSHQQSPFYAVSDLLQQGFAAAANPSPEMQLEALVQALTAADLSPDESVPLVAPLLGLSVPAERFLPPSLSPEQQRRKLLATLIAWVFGAARRQPTIVVLEDLHWVDPSTMELQGLLAEQGRAMPLLLLYTGRPEFAGSRLRDHHTLLTLNHLGRQHTREMVRRVSAGAGELPDAVMETVVARSDGVPLFIEELTKAVAEQGAKPARQIPATLQDSLMARLDRMQAGKEVAQMAAVIGREFSYGLIKAISEWPEEAIEEALCELANAHLIFVRGVPPDATYTFKHALIEDTAYASLLKSRRRALHQATARALVRLAPTVESEQPELLAHHFAEAGRAADAIPFWQQAGQRALQRSANQEAIGHVTKGLDLIKSLPDTPERAQQELALQIPLGLAWMALKGYGAPEVQVAYSRAYELCQRLGKSPQLAPVLAGLENFFLVRADFRSARAISDDLLLVAEQSQDRMCGVSAHLHRGVLLAYMGELVGAREHLERSLALYQARDNLAAVYSEDPASTGRIYLGMALWHLGQPDRARRTVAEGLQAARDVGHPLGLAQALSIAATVHLYARDWAGAQALAVELTSFTREHGILLWGILSTILQVAASIEIEGVTPEAVEVIRHGCLDWQATGTTLGVAFFMTLLAPAYARAGKTAEALRAAAEGLSAAEKAERVELAELWRLQGELTLQAAAGTPGRTACEAAEVSFWRAIETARAQEAKSYELRAVTSLGQLWRGQGKRREARALLGDLYGWFTEGFATADLQRARALLAELA